MQRKSELIDEAKVKEMFDMLDADGGGSIDTGELTQAFIALGISDTKEEIELLVREIDTDGSGEIEYEEFCAMIRKLQDQRDSTSEILKAFNCFSDGKERITLTDLRRACAEVGDPRADQFLQEMFIVADVDKDGVVTFQDFKAMMERAIEHEHQGLTSPSLILDAANAREGVKL